MIPAPMIPAQLFAGWAGAAAALGAGVYYVALVRRGTATPVRGCGGGGFVLLVALSFAAGRAYFARVRR